MKLASDIIALFSGRYGRLEEFYFSIRLTKSRNYRNWLFCGIWSLHPKIYSELGKLARRLLYILDHSCKIHGLLVQHATDIGDAEHIKGIAPVDA